METRSHPNNTPETSRGAPQGALQGVSAAFVVLALTAGLAALLGRFLFYPMLSGELIDPDSKDDSDLTFQFSDLVESSPGDGKRLYDVYVGRWEELDGVDRIGRPKHGGAGPVVGPAFAPWDQTYSTYRADSGLGFDFRVPLGWGCQDVTSGETSDRGVAANYCVRWPEVGPGGPYSRSVGDESNYLAEVYERPLLGPGPVRGFVLVSSCRPGPCDPDDAGRLDPRVTHSVRGEPVVSKSDYSATVRRPDPTTAFVEQTTNSEIDGLPRYLVSMVHLYRREGDGPPDARVLVTLAGPPEAREEMQKTVNDVREATP